MPPQKRLVLKGYYTTGEAMNVLGVRKDMLYAFVRNERLTKHIPPGRKQAYYARQEVDDLARELRAFVAAGNGRASSRFVRCMPEDMEECAHLINALFYHYPTIERWKQYLERNPDYGYLLKVDGKIMGCAFVMPLRSERIAELMAIEETHTPSIAPDEIEPYVLGRQYHLYIRAVGIQPGLSREDKRILGSRLISGMIKAIIALGERGIDIRTIQARSRTPDGIRIMRHMGFTEVPSTTTSRNFLIDVEQSGIPEIEEYKVALARYKAAERTPTSH